MPFPQSFPKTGAFVLRNARVPTALLVRPEADQPLADLDIAVEAGRIAGLAAAGAAPPAEGVPIFDCDGGLALPAFVDLHTHLDKGHIWPRKQNPDGTWLGALLAVKDDREANWAAGDVARRMDFSLRCAYAHGTAAIRTHLDSAPPQHEITFDIFEAARADWAGRIELQGVALLGADICLDPAQLRKVARRAKTGGGILGGSTAVHGDNRRIMDNLVEAAGEFGLDLDLHTDETGDASADALLSLAEAVLASGFKGRVTAGHCCALAVQDEKTVRRTIETVAEAGIAVVSLPMCNMYLQDRAGARTPRWRGVTLVRELAAAGVPVAIASDNTRDPFYAYGDLDMVEVLREGARILHLDHPQGAAFAWTRLVTATPAAIAGMAHPGRIGAGGAADLVLFRARDWTELLARPQADRIVIRGGRAIDTALPDYRELDDLMEA